jgi:hypothetical protein
MGKQQLTQLVWAEKHIRSQGGRLNSWPNQRLFLMWSQPDILIGQDSRPLSP